MCLATCCSVCLLSFARCSLTWIAVCHVISYVHPLAPAFTCNQIHYTLLCSHNHRFACLIYISNFTHAECLPRGCRYTCECLPRGCRYNKAWMSHVFFVCLLRKTHLNFLCVVSTPADSYCCCVRCNKDYIISCRFCTFLHVSFHTFKGFSRGDLYSVS